MKYAITCLILFCSPLFGLTQEDESPIKVLPEPIVGTKQAQKNIEFIYELDVFQYYELYAYDTELKKAMFKKTSAYLAYQKELKTIRQDLFKSIYYLKQEDLFISANYNLKRKGFVISLGGDCGRIPKSVGWSEIQLKALPISKGKYGEENLFISVNEKSGLEIEENKENIDTYFLFTPNGKELVNYKFMRADARCVPASKKVIISNNVRIVVANRQTGRIYYDKSYSVSSSNIKK